MNENLDPYNDWDAAYVLGALSMDERRDFELHLVGCGNCAAAVAELAGIPGILTKIDTQDAISLMEAPSVEDLYDVGYEFGLLQKLARAAVEQKRRLRVMRAVGIAAASAVLIVGGIVLGSAIDQTGNPVPNSVPSALVGIPVAMSEVAPEVMTVELSVTRKPWGTRFDWSCNYGGESKPGYGPQSYDLVITDTNGVETTVASWIATGSGAKGLAAASKVPTANIRSVDIRASGSSVPLARGNL